MAVATDSITAFQDQVLNLLPAVNPSETINAAQDQVLDAVRRTYDTVVGLVDMWARSATSVLPEPRPLPGAGALPDPGSVVESTFAFLDRLLAAQKEFALAVVGAARPVLGAPGRETGNSKPARRPASRPAT